MAVGWQRDWGDDAGLSLGGGVAFFVIPWYLPEAVTAIRLCSFFMFRR